VECWLAERLWPGDFGCCLQGLSALLEECSGSANGQPCHGFVIIGLTLKMAKFGTQMIVVFGLEDMQRVGSAASLCTTGQISLEDAIW
jgi:hypothetical protein